MGAFGLGIKRDLAIVKHNTAKSHQVLSQLARSLQGRYATMAAMKRDEILMLKKIPHIALMVLLLASCSRDVVGQPTTTPLPSPAQLLQQAEQHQQADQVDLALSDYQQVLLQYPDAPEARVAKFGVAYSAFLRQDWAAAWSQLSAFINEQTHDQWHLRALFLLGRVAEIQGDHAIAIEAYQQYEDLKGLLSGYAAQRRAAQLQATNQTEQAVAAYAASGRYDMAGPQRVASLNKALEFYDQTGQAEQALTQLEVILSFARTPSFRSTTLLDAARRALRLGKTEQARIWLREIINQHPTMSEAPIAIDELAALGESTPVLAAAGIAYNHGQYLDAVSLFDQVLANGLAGEEAAEIERKRALALRQLDDYAGAQAAFNSIAERFADLPIGRQARLDAIQTQGQAGDREGSRLAYLDFAERYPDDPLAPEALRRVVEITSWSGDPAATANAQIMLGQRYPWSHEGQQALHAAGRYAWDTGQVEQAAAVWQLLGDSNIGPPRAEGYYWLGRLEISRGNREKGEQLLRSAQAADPNSYYAARVADALNINDGDQVPIGSPISPEAEQAGWQWIASWSTAPTSDTLDTEPYSLRAEELSWTDLHSEAQAEWIAARDAALNNPFSIYRVALAALRSDMPYATVTTAQKLVQLAPIEAGEPSVAIRQLLYPTPYPSAVVTKSQEFGLDPRVLYAVMRQESIFNPNATSWVGARGLAQVMPSTGEGIAQNLGIEGFSVDDLYNPVTSIRFGAYYIDAQIEYMSGSLPGAFAAYNGGPGNAERWADGRVVADPDRFIEIIDYAETRHYVEVVYANYGAYRRLYQQP